MSRLNEHLKSALNEKISKKEIDSALKSKEIYVGGEYEFYADVLKEYDGQYTEYERLYQDALYDWNAFNKAYEEYQEEYQEARDLEERKIAEIEEIEEQISEKEDELADIESDKDEYEEELTALEKELDETDNLFNPDVAEEGVDFDTIEDLKVQIATATRNFERKDAEYIKVQDEIEELEKKKSDAEDERDDAVVEYEERIEYPYPDSDYVEYMRIAYEDYGYYWAISIDDIQNSYFEGDLPEPQEMEGSGNLGDEEFWEEAVNDVLVPIIDREAPFDDYRVGGYHSSSQSIGDKYWRIEHDGSISDEGGVEIISPPQLIGEFLSDCKDMFDFIRDNGSTDGGTGFHVHMSIKGVDNLEGKLDPVKLVLLTDEEYIWQCFDERATSSYVTKMKEPLMRRGINKEDLSNIVDHRKLKALAMSSGHNDAINLSHWREGHVEFRYMGGSDYHRKYKTVETMIGRFAHTLLAACSDTYKEEEYLTKMSRILTKIDMYKWQKVMFAYNDFIKNFNDVISAYKDPKEVTIFPKYLKQQMENLRKMIKSMGVSPLSGEQLHGLKMYKNDEMEAFVVDYMINDIISFTKKKKWSKVSDEYQYFIQALKHTNPHIAKKVDAHR